MAQIVDAHAAVTETVRRWLSASSDAEIRDRLPWRSRLSSAEADGWKRNGGGVAGNEVIQDHRSRIHARNGSGQELSHKRLYAKVYGAPERCRIDALIPIKTAVPLRCLRYNVWRDIVRCLQGCCVPAPIKHGHRTRQGLRLSGDPPYSLLSPASTC